MNSDQENNSQPTATNYANGEAEPTATSADEQPTQAASEKNTSDASLTTPDTTATQPHDNDAPSDDTIADKAAEQPAKKQPTWRQHFWQRYCQYVRRGVLHPSWSQQDKGRYFGFISIVIISLFNALTATLLMNQLEERLSYIRLIDPQLGIGYDSTGIGFFVKIFLLSILLYVVYSLIGWLLHYWVQGDHQTGYNSYVTLLMRQNSIILPLTALMMFLALIAASTLFGVIAALFILECVLAIVSLGISLYHERHRESLDSMYVIILAIVLSLFIGLLILKVSMMPVIVRILELLLA
ncbi:MAG: hypothetical protein H9901_01610 [Candidatus Paralactobacillus gallistercoris]|uniref:Uncharacterized protein n=1 Tax=Candidatus Paralactobacillus gallistercoris TaxID=2838724 RepID=A0A948TJ25_9LACO|nr:hypothetical protein [Candidatus Paralactobacillus gallistercoris]